jgi:hypothetical protein
LLSVSLRCLCSFDDLPLGQDEVVVEDAADVDEGEVSPAIDVRRAVLRDALTLLVRDAAVTVAEQVAAPVRLAAPLAH